MRRKEGSGFRVQGSGFRFAAGLAPRACRLFAAVALLFLLLNPLAPHSPSAHAADSLRPINEAAALGDGIRKLSGKHVTLLTDLPSRPEVEALPAIFDQAFPQWCAYFGVDPAGHSAWQVRGFVIKDKPRFLRLGLLPAGLPPFEHAYSVAREFWVYDQPSDYFRAHLMLHEGTHCFMESFLGGCGPPWYMEGIAELLATHRWQDGKLELNCFPASREEVPMWGRIKIVKDGFAARHAKTLAGVLQYGPQAHRQTEPYAWCWAAAVLLDRHPRYQRRFRQMAKLVRQRDFTDRFVQSIGDDWDDLAEEWQVFVADLEYGYDVPRAAIDFAPGKPLPAAGATVSVAADRGWQPSGLRLEGGRTYRLRASGRYQVADRPQTWWCEPGGVSIRYYHGRPLGVLLAAIRPDPPRPPGPSPFIAPIAVGLGTAITPKHSGTLYLRINDSAAELGDNAGTLSVEIQREPE